MPDEPTPATSIDPASSIPTPEVVAPQVTSAQISTTATPRVDAAGGVGRGKSQSPPLRLVTFGLAGGCAALMAWWIVDMFAVLAPANRIDGRLPAALFPVMLFLIGLRGFSDLRWPPRLAYACGAVLLAGVVYVALLYTVGAVLHARIGGS
ncbi:MAG: hypothetical protein QM811_30245 [Pirellulales bacterium]